MTTERAAGGFGDRLIDNIVLTSPLAKRPVVGYENHAGRTHLGAGVEPFGAVASSTGHGNNDADKQDGVRYKNVVGTYLHGPLLAKNPEVADDLLARALHRGRAESLSSWRRSTTPSSKMRTTPWSRSWECTGSGKLAGAASTWCSLRMTPLPLRYPVGFS